jgi:phage host-nuclease inhibitor protein Gam
LDGLKEKGRDIRRDAREEALKDRIEELEEEKKQMEEQMNQKVAALEQMFQSQMGKLMKSWLKKAW